MTADPLTVTCSHCGAAPGQRCGTVSDWARKPHAARSREAEASARLAVALAAHSDPALDAFFAPLDSCGICAVPGLPQRHRVIDAIAGALEAGEDPEEVALDYAVTPEAVETIVLWMVRWPGAWE